MEKTEETIDINSLPFETLVSIAEFLAPNDFFSLRLTSKQFKKVADSQYFIWEPKKISSDTTRMLEFNLGTPPNEHDLYYFGAQHGEFRWPGGQLFMCRSGDHAIEVKELSYNFKEDSVRCSNLASLMGHKSKITALCSSDLNVFVSGDQTGVVIVWEQNEQGFVKTQLKTHPEQRDHITAIALPSEGKLITGDNAGRLSYWSSYSQAPCWQINLGKPIVNIKIVPKTKSLQIEVACINTEQQVFEITRYHRDNGSLIIKLNDFRCDPLNAKYPLASLRGFRNNMYSEFRSDTTTLENQKTRTTLSCWNSKAQSNEESYQNSCAFFRPSKNINEFFNYQTTPLSNGNILFWKQNGDARLFFQKRSPICVSTPDKPKDFSFIRRLTTLTKNSSAPPFQDEPDDTNEENLIY